mgnify:CR=1 FL=1|tara:strand:- start:714 stop:1028 length:315 start_codon:yes stop_codon:yes gene_type:complete
MTTPTIKYDFWLTFANNGSAKGPMPRITKGQPQAGRGERAVRCTASLPASLFAIPSISVTIDIDDQARPDIESKVRAGAAAFKESVGMDIDLVIHAAEAAEDET